MSTAAREGDLGLGHGVMWNWALDFEDRDQEFLLRVGILPALTRMASFQRQSEYFPAVRPLGPSVTSLPQHPVQLETLPLFVALVA